MRLLRSELLRTYSRRLVWMVVLGGVLATLIAWGFAAYYSHKPTAAEVASAQQTFDRNVGACLRHTGSQVPPGYDSADQYCRENVGPSLDGDLDVEAFSDAAVFQEQLHGVRHVRGRTERFRLRRFHRQVAFRRLIHQQQAPTARP